MSSAWIALMLLALVPATPAVSEGEPPDSLLQRYSAFATIAGPPVTSGDLPRQIPAPPAPRKHLPRRSSTPEYQDPWAGRPPLLRDSQPQHPSYGALPFV